MKVRSSSVWGAHVFESGVERKQSYDDPQDCCHMIDCQLMHGRFRASSRHANLDILVHT